MTPRQENSIERSVGRIEAQLEALADAVKALAEAVAVVKDSAEPMRADIAELKRRADLAAAVTEKFNALDQSIRDGKMQFRGAIIGVGIAGGAAGATAATGLKWLYALLFGA
jgi:predicted RNase H-like nuclease (RuvC/YqgF family)